MMQSMTMPMQTLPLSMPTVLARESATGVVEKTNAGEKELRETFGQFVGEAFFGQLMKAMRSNVGKPAYFHGGRAEEVFQGQLDQVLAEKISSSSADRFAGPMFELFQLQRQG